MNDFAYGKCGGKCGDGNAETDGPVTILNIRVRMQVANWCRRVSHRPLVTSDLALVLNFSHNCPSSSSAISMEKLGGVEREIARNSFPFSIFTFNFFDL